MAEEYLTSAEAAERLRVSEETVRRWCRAGRLPTVQIGRAHRIPLQAVVELVHAGSRDPDAGHAWRAGRAERTQDNAGDQRTGARLVPRRRGGGSPLRGLEHGAAAKTAAARAPAQRPQANHYRRPLTPTDRHRASEPAQESTPADALTHIGRQQAILWRARLPARIMQERIQSK